MTISACGEPRRTLSRLLILAGVALLGLSIHVHFLASYYGDKQWEMLYAQMWLSGKQLYSGIFPVSPPLITWVYGIPATLARLMHANEFDLLIVLGLALTAACIFLSDCLIRLHSGFEKKHMRLQFMALLCFVFIVRTSSIYFLDREHLFTVMTFPYLLRLLPALSRKSIPLWLSAAIGLVAGIGFCFKPYCLVLWAGIQLFTWWDRKSPRMLLAPENLVIYTVGALYLLSVWLLYPDYFTIVLPMALITYSAARDTHPVLDYLGNAVCILLAAFLMFRPRDASPYRRDICYLAALCPALFAYTLLNNNWAYTYYPLSTLALIITGFLLWEFLYLYRNHSPHTRPNWPTVIAICAGLGAYNFAYVFYPLTSAALLVTACAAWEFLYLTKEEQSQRKEGWRLTAGQCACLIALASRALISLNYFSMVLTDSCHNNVYCKGDDRMVAEFVNERQPVTFGSISIDFARWTRLVHYTGALWQTRFPQLWMLPQFLISDENFMRKHQWILDYVAKGFADDMNNNKPAFMFVDDTNLFYVARVHLDLVNFFRANPDFRDAFAHYRFSHMLDLCDAPGATLTPEHNVRCRYYVYRRAD